MIKMKLLKRVLRFTLKLILLPIVYPASIIVLFYDYKVEYIRKMTMDDMIKHIDEVYSSIGIVILIIFHILTLGLFIKIEE